MFIKKAVLATGKEPNSAYERVMWAPKGDPLKTKKIALPDIESTRHIHPETILDILGRPTCLDHNPEKHETKNSIVQDFGEGFKDSSLLCIWVSGYEPIVWLAAEGITSLLLAGWKLLPEIQPPENVQLGKGDEFPLNSLYLISFLLKSFVGKNNLKNLGLVASRWERESSMDITMIVNGRVQLPRMNEPAIFLPGDIIAADTTPGSTPLVDLIKISKLQFPIWQTHMFDTHEQKELFINTIIETQRFCLPEGNNIFQGGRYSARNAALSASKRPSLKEGRSFFCDLSITGLEGYQSEETENETVLFNGQKDTAWIVFGEDTYTVKDVSVEHKSPFISRVHLNVEPEMPLEGIPQRQEP